MAHKPAQTFYAVLPPQEGAADYARQISRLMQKDQESVEPLLRQPVWTLLRRYAQRGNAESFRDQLHAFGVRVFLVSDTAISGHLFIWMKSANKGAGGLAFADFDDQPSYCPFEDIAAICTGHVRREDGSQALFIDLLRKSTPITPRLDASLFDFSAIMKVREATAEAFIESIFDPASVHHDDNFDEQKDHLESLVTKGFASLPGNLEPPENAMKHSGYDKDDLRLFNIHSFLLREELLADIGENA